MNDISVRDFVASQRALLELELKAEEEEEKSIESLLHTKKNGDDERVSHVLRKLEALETSVGLYGRTMVTLGVMDGRGEVLLPAHRLTVGDEVEIQRQKSSSGGRGEIAGGVISTVTDTSISIALFGKQNRTNNKGNDGEDDDGVHSFLNAPPLAVIPKSSVEVHRKLVRSLGELERDGVDHAVAGNIVGALFGQVPSFPECKVAPIEPFNDNLDESQLDAISFALYSGQRPVSLIHGPPGTGKTTTIAELIKQAVFVHKYKVLVTAPSNVAVDNVLERLVLDHQSSNSKQTKRSKRKDRKALKVKTVRLGHPARIKESILPYSLESLVQNAEGTEIVSDVRDELQSFLRVLSNPKSRGTDKRVAYKEIKALRKEVKSREQKVVKDLIREAQVVLATNVGAANHMLHDVEFDLVIIDEAAQALEASCWIPILRGKRLVLAGDHCQLPPTIKSNTSNVQKALGKTLFERTMERYGDNECPDKKGTVSRMLKVQYRMHLDIADWASTVMYQGQLETHEGVKTRTLSELPHVQGKDEDDIGETKLLLIDTTGCDMYETVNDAGSRFNDSEAQIVAQHVRALLELGLKQEEIAVISPYNGQVELLRTLLLPDAPKLEIRSVDGFQGGEREAVVLSLVRSSDRGATGIGFLKDDRRLNVAVTRAKRHCALVCDSETVSQSKFIKSLVDWIEEHGVFRSAVEYSSSQQGQLESDIQAAELELLRMVDTSPPSPKKKNDSGPKPSQGANACSSISLSRDRGQGTERGSNEERRKRLLSKITTFAESGEAGSEMRLSPDLSRFDRRVVHEFATELGLDHRSEGVEGVDRRIILAIKKSAQATETQTSEVKSLEEAEKESEKEVVRRPLTFQALDFDSDDESSGEEKEPRDDRPTAMNSVLADLAKERLQREQQVKKNDEQFKAVQVAKAGKRKGKKKKKGQKLGTNTTRPATKEVHVSTEDNADDLDDMAFLDAQIEKVQTSHGRKIDGKGSYRSIVNGILVSKPAPSPVAKKNQRAASALQAKLKESQDGRKSKKKGKKK